MQKYRKQETKQRYVSFRTLESPSCWAYHLYTNIRATKFRRRLTLPLFRIRRLTLPRSCHRPWLLQQNIILPPIPRDGLSLLSRDIRETRLCPRSAVATSGKDPGAQWWTSDYWLWILFSSVCVLSCALWLTSLPTKRAWAESLTELEAWAAVGWVQLYFLVRPCPHKDIKTLSEKPCFWQTKNKICLLFHLGDVSFTGQLPGAVPQSDIGLPLQGIWWREW